MSKENKISFIEEIKKLLQSAKERAVVAINIAMVYTYYEIGRRIVSEEQNGKSRAEYGKEILQKLSSELTKEFGRGYSIRNLWLIRRFYLVYSNVKIPQSLIAQSHNYHKTTDGKVFFLSWLHYVILTRIDNSDERHFYEIESYANKWSARELKRQYDSSLYERLALSRNKGEIKKLAQVGQVIEKPIDAIKVH